MKSHSKENEVKTIWKNDFSTWKGPSEKSFSLIPLLFRPLSDIMNSICKLLLSKLLVVIRVIPKAGIFSKFLIYHNKHLLSSSIKKINGKVFSFFHNGKTCICLPGIKSFRQKTMQSDQIIKNKTLLLKKINKKINIIQ